MSPNTIKRIVSAVVLATVLGICIYLGRQAILGFVCVVGTIAIDEIYCNIFKSKRVSPFYLIAQVIFLAPFIFFQFVEPAFGLLQMFTNAAVVLNIFMLVYLFFIKMESNALKGVSDQFPFISGIIVGLPLMSIASMVHFDNWKSLLAVLLVVNFGMDTGAWFFGKNFGKNKLWPAVSPNKTIEGLIGGIFTSGILGCVMWYFLFDMINVQLFVFFAFLGLMSQLGDLVQSKMKRQYNIKDSSNLIPGHGGFYDRIDSLLFLGPFFATSLSYFLFK